MLTLVGSRCKLCKRALVEDEGVGVAYKDKLLWLHDDCAGKVRRFLKKRRQQEERVGTRSNSDRSRRMGAVYQR